MCGIVGVVHLDDRPVERHNLRRMCDALRHRGPDDEGLHVDKHVGLAMRRLSVVDVGGGHQPQYNEDETVAVVQNGEIYNFPQLGPTLTSLGHTFRTRSDTEAIVHAYEQWGDDCPSRLSGMFAFAIWDSRARKLLLARDRVGKKPLYYYFDGRRFVFASEIKAILHYESVPRRLNLEALNAYVTLGYVPGPSTMYECIYKLPAGHTLSVTTEGLAKRAYWDLSFDRNEAWTEVGATEKLREILEQSVRSRLMSDVPLGALLSGGIDSSVVVALMSRMSSQPVNTYTVGFEESELNELPFAKTVATQFGTNHHELVVDTCRPELLEKVVYHLDEPLADPAAIPTFLISVLARETVKVVLTGEGGDELFAGYDYYQWSRQAGRFEILPPRVSRVVLPVAARAVNQVIGRPRYHERTIWYWSLPRHLKLTAWTAVFTDEAKRQLLDTACRSKVPEDHFRAAVQSLHNQSNAKSELDRWLYIDTKLWLTDDLLMKVDKMSMAASVEARCPLLDYELLEFAATLPEHLKLRGGNSKWLLKEAARAYLPASIIERPKHPFLLPLKRWLTHSLRGTVREVLARGILSEPGILDRRYVENQLWQQFEGDRPGSARRVWSMLNLGLWAQQNGF